MISATKEAGDTRFFINAKKIDDESKLIALQTYEIFSSIQIKRRNTGSGRGTKAIVGMVDGAMESAEEFGSAQHAGKLTRKELATLGEDHAAKHIASLGYRVVKRNFRYGRVGEIDIVAYDGECLVFIEVKARQDYSHGPPEAAIDARKQSQLKRVAKMYYYVNSIAEAVCRFDVIAVDILSKKVDIRHHKNAFS